MRSRHPAPSVRSSAVSPGKERIRNRAGIEELPGVAFPTAGARLPAMLPSREGKLPLEGLLPASGECCLSWLEAQHSKKTERAHTFGLGA
jgi:hypothetical protein